MGVLIQHCARKAFTLALSIPRSIRKMKVIFLFLSTFSIMYWVQCAEYSCPEMDVDFWGYDIDELHDVSDWHDCGDACQLVSSCMYWTLTKEKRCVLKSSDAGLTKYPGSISGARGCS